MAPPALSLLPPAQGPECEHWGEPSIIRRWGADATVGRGFPATVEIGLRHLP